MENNRALVLGFTLLLLCSLGFSGYTIISQQKDQQQLNNSFKHQTEKLQNQLTLLFQEIKKEDREPAVPINFISINEMTAPTKGVKDASEFTIKPGESVKITTEVAGGKILHLITAQTIRLINAEPHALINIVDGDLKPIKTIEVTPATKQVSYSSLLLEVVSISETQITLKSKTILF